MPPNRNKTICFLLAVIFLGVAGCRESSAPAETAQEEKKTGSGPSSAGRDRMIVAFGDSLTAGLRVDAGDTYPAVLEKKIHAAGYGYRVINAGVSGETTAGGLRRVPNILEIRPEIVILELGVNDGLRGLSLDQTEKNLGAMIELLQKEKVLVVLAGMRLPPNYGKEYTSAFENIFPSLAARYRLTLIPFFLEGVAAQSNLNQADGIHPTAQGYQIIVENLWPKIEPLLKK